MPGRDHSGFFLESNSHYMRWESLKPPPIRELPSSLLARVRGSGQIVDLAQIVEECVGNSIDACATEIRVDVDFAALSVCVTDNGVGIAVENLVKLGVDGVVPANARLSQAQALGFRGEFLLSLAQTAVVEVVSRQRGSFQTYSHIVRAGMTVKSGLALQQQTRQGTRLSVRDVFFNQPVRRGALQTAG